MQQIILAIQTPRAGKWNHRWIVPVGCQTDDVTLKDALSRFDSLISGAFHKDGIVFCRSVEQTTSGRSAREFIFLYFPDFYDKVTAQGKNHCHDLLRAFFDSQMDQMVTSIDWDNTDGTMIYQSPVLVSLYKDLERVIQQNRVQKNVSDNDVQKRGGAGCWHFMMTLVLILSALFYFNHGNIREWLNQHLNQSQEVSENDNGKTTPVQPSSPSSGITDNTSDELNDGDYEQWQKLFTLPPNETDLHKRYEMVQAAINAAYTYYYGLTPNNDTSLSKKGHFVQDLLKILNPEMGSPLVYYDKPQNKDPEFEKTIRDVKPDEFRKSINELYKSNEEGSKILNECSDSPEPLNQLKTTLDNMSELVKVKPWNVSDFPDIYPNFFFDTDKSVNGIQDDYFSEVDKYTGQAKNDSSPANIDLINQFYKQWDAARTNYLKALKPSK